MSVQVEVQYAVEDESIPPESAFRIWSRAALGDRETPADLVIRIVDEEESRQLNSEYRGKDCATNILSFPFEPPVELPSEETGNHLGDLVICAPVVNREAGDQRKPLAAHWAHMVVHGVLHLCGFDHGNEQEAQVMEDREREILDALGISDPYAGQ